MERSSAFLRLLGAAAVSAALVGSASLVQPAKAAVVVGHSVHVVALFVKNHCPEHGGVRSTPCAIVFSSSNPGPNMVSVSIPVTKKGAMEEADKCAGIATNHGPGQ